MRQHRSTDGRARIIEEAEHLIHLRGYRGTSLGAIASRCKMTKANLLHHFQSKEELGLAVLDYKMDCTRRNCLDAMFSLEADPFEAVGELFASAARFHRANGCKAGCFIANIALEMSDLNDRFRERTTRFFDEWADRIERNLRRHQAEGLFGPGLDARTTAEALLALYEGAVMLGRTRRDPRVFDRTGRVALGLLDAHRAAAPSSAVNAATRR